MDGARWFHFQWHPELEIGFAFVPTSLHILDLVNERGRSIKQRCFAVWALNLKVGNHQRSASMRRFCCSRQARLTSKPMLGK